MVSRRESLQLAGTALIGSVAGCIGWADSTNTPEATGTIPPTETTSTPDEPDGWEPAWRRTTPGSHVRGLEAHGGSLYATLSDDHDGPSAVVEVDQSDGSARWRTTFEGGATDVTSTGDHVYSIHRESHDWTALLALERATGERRWSLRRDRRLAVHGVADGIVVATGQEFFEPETVHDTPEEPLVSDVYGVDVDTGEVRWRDAFAGVVDVAVGDDAAYVVAGSRLVAVGLDGERRWTVESDHEARTARTAGERVYYLAGGDGVSTVYGLDPGGETEWTRTLPVEEVLLDGDRLYAGGEAVFALDPDGSVAWRDDVYGSRLLLDPRRKTLYTRSVSGQTRAYDLPGGDELWSFVPEKTYGWPMTATAETAIVAGHTPGKALYAVDRASGAAQKRFYAGERGSLYSAVSIDGRVFVRRRSGLFAFDP